MKKYIGLFMIAIAVFGIKVSFIHAEGGLGLGLNEIRQNNQQQRDEMRKRADEIQRQRELTNQGIRDGRKEMRDGIQGEREDMNSTIKTDRENMREGFKTEREDMKNNPEMTQAEKDALKIKIKAERESFNAEMQAKREAFRTEVEKERADFKAKSLEERSKFRMSAIEMKSERFANAIKNLETIQAKVQAKITALKAEGKDTASAQVYLDTSISELASAKAIIAKITIPATDTSITAENFADIKNTARDARNLLEKSREDLHSAIKSLIILMTPTTSTPTTVQ